ncbi:hypothetical protein BD410DRAFT_790047 [Rickenella mellea]|uniref:DUF7587 domain-containing protein n=1 Tax=Rickenella mellea TaxID=50990 RepID=A0A4Y7Q1I2_9AGAM|nr:hypothetical protein BD410DRAFT_790047 [Rickenella mellea]
MSERTPPPSPRKVISPSTTPRKLKAFGFTRVGFGSAEETLEELIAEHPFLYRVHHDMSFTKFHSASGFTAGLYKDESITSALTQYQTRSSDRHRHEADVSAEVRGVLLPSPFVSVSLSLPYALRRAERLHTNKCQGVKITVINARSVSEDAFIALDTCSSAIRNGLKEGYKWYYDYANAFQEVLVPVNIPSSAIYASVSWVDIEGDGYLPRWFVTCGDNPIPLSRLVYESHQIQNFFADVRRRFNTGIDETIAKSDSCRFAFYLLDHWLRGYGIELGEGEYVDNTLTHVAVLAYEILRWPTLPFEGSRAVRCKAESWNVESLNQSIKSRVCTELRRRWGIRRRLTLKARLKEIEREQESIRGELSGMRHRRTSSRRKGKKVRKV